MDRLEAKLLVDCEECIPTLAEWFEGQWGHLGPRLTRESQQERLKRTLNRRTIPLTIVVFRGLEPVGTACLSDEGHASRPEWSPWLEFVFVPVDHRKEGIGSFAVNRAVEIARDLGIRQLYLSTKKEERLYSVLGWSVVERVPDDQPAVIMDIVP